MKKALLYTKKLETAGLERALAEAHVEILEEIFEDEMATKADILGTRNDLRTEMQAMRGELKAEIQELRSELKAEIQELRSELRTEVQSIRSDLKLFEQRTTLKFGIMTIASATFIISALSLLKFL